jgi:HAE1 family hydrophobic/amphiphilic exporter-1
MIFIGVMVFGLYSLINLPVDLYPDIEYPAITVITTYNGANASDIETNVTRPIEEVLNSVDNLKEISSVSRDNSSVVSLEFEYETDLSEAANDIRESLAFIEDFLPEGADKPTVFKFNTSMMPILFFSVTADESYEGIYELLEERLMNPLNRVEGIASIYLTGTPRREIEIQVDPHKMEAHNLTVEQIGNVLQIENLNMPTGNIKMGKMKYPVRVEGEFEQSYQIKDIVLGNMNGQTIYLKDVATVKDSIAEMTIDERVNGKRSVSMMVMKQSGANTVNIAQKVNEEIKVLQKNLPPDIEILTIFDSSEFITDSINNLAETLLFAFFFVILVVLFFLGRWRATFIIALTIPIALIVSFIYLHLTDNTLNIISLSSLAIAIGMVVDDAIVVLENISKHIDRGSSPREAAIYATNEVWLAVIVTTLTVVAVFFPMTMIGGLTGVMFRQLGWIVTITVVTSTVAAITLTPMLSSKLLKLQRKKPSVTRRAYDNSIRPVLDGLDNWYGRTLKWAIHHKLFVTITAFVIFFASIMLMSQIGAEFIPQSDEGRLTMSVELVPGTRLEETSKIAREIDGIIAEGYPEVVVNSASAGSEENAGIAAIFMSTGSNIINYSLSLTDASERERSVWDVAEALRQDLSQIPEIKTFNVTMDDGGGMGGNNVDVEIYGYDLEKTTLLANKISEKVKTIEGARDVTISREEAKPQLKVELDREKIAKAGLNTAMVSSALRNRIDGLTATRFREFGDEYDVTVRFKEEYRNSITDIENIAISNAMGKLIRVGEIGEVVEYWAPPNIERKSRERVITVSTKPYKTSLGELAGEIQNVIDETDIPREMMVEVGGAYEDQQESFMDLSLLLLLSLVLVFIVMASQFESFKMPFIIMFSIPFAFTGVMLALFITNTTLSVIAGLGAIMLIGIVVKNAVVLVDYINLMRDRGYDLDTAIVESGKARLRPVLMTAFTTILGMLPLAIGIGEGSEIWSPMGISVIGGLIFSTIITMVIVPVIYRAFTKSGERDSKEKLRKKFVFMDQ